MKPRRGLSKQEKLRRRRQFSQVYIRGRRLSGPRLTILCAPNQLKVSRLGLSVGKKRFKLSTRRHYIQRCLREAYRLNKRQILPGYDIIITALRYDQDKSFFADIQEELLMLAKKAGLLKAKVR